MPDATTVQPGADFHEDDSLTRRNFVAQAGLTIAGACYAGAIGYPIYRYLSAPARTAAELAAITEVAIPEADLPPAGSVLMFRFGTKPAMLIHHTDGALAAFDAVCTHLGCTVQYQPEHQRIFCACHGGVYDPQTGANVAGPPPKPLNKFNVEVANGQIVITRA